MTLQILYTVVVVVVALLFAVALRQNRFWLVGGLLLGLVVLSLVGANKLGENYIGLFGIGGCVTCPASILMLLLLIAGPLFLKTFDAAGPEQGRGARRILYIVGSLVILYAMLVPLIAAEMNRVSCNNANREVGMTIAEALEAYQSDNGTYPETLEELIPAYMEEIPQAVCLFNEFDGMMSHRANFYLAECDDENLLYTTDYDISFSLVYNLETGVWGRASMFDGVCSVPAQD